MIVYSNRVSDAACFPLLLFSSPATVIPDIASHLPPDTLAGIAYIAPCPFIGPVMLNMGTPFILELLTTLASADDALTQERALDAFADSCFRDPASVDWRLRAFWRGMGAYVGREQRRFVTTRAQDPAALFALASGRAVDAATQRPVPPVPVLLQIGREDAHIFVDRLEAEMRPHFADLEYVVLPGRGHSIHVECEEEVMDRILAFARRVFALPTPSTSIVSRTRIRNSKSNSAVPADSSSLASSSASEDDDEETINDESGKAEVGRASSVSSSMVPSAPTALIRALTSLRNAFGAWLGYR